MNKSTFVAITLGIVGGLIFAVGMVMALMEKWNLLVPGIVVGSIGLLILLAIYPVYRKMNNLPFVKINAKTCISCIIGIFGTLMLGIGMCFVLIPESFDMFQGILGIVVGSLGLLIVAFNPLIYKFTETKSEGKEGK